MSSKLNAWADRELLAELRQLMDADCIVFDVLQGAPPQRKDATHHFVRLLELAERGILPIEQRADASELRGNHLEQGVADTAAKAEE